MSHGRAQRTLDRIVGVCHIRDMNAPQQPTTSERLTAAITPSGQNAAVGGGGALAFLLVLWLTKQGYDVDPGAAVVLGSLTSAVTGYLHHVFGILIAKLERL